MSIDKPGERPWTEAEFRERQEARRRALAAANAAQDRRHTVRLIVAGGVAIVAAGYLLRLLLS
jgi:hypothetical protein